MLLEAPKWFLLTQQQLQVCIWQLQHFPYKCWNANSSHSSTENKTHNNEDRGPYMEPVNSNVGQSCMLQIQTTKHSKNKTKQQGGRMAVWWKHSTWVQQAVDSNPNSGSDLLPFSASSAKSTGNSHLHYSDCLCVPMPLAVSKVFSYGKKDLGSLTCAIILLHAVQAKVRQWQVCWSAD